MHLLHHLARTGGTLISRCLASMHGVCLLSEINPHGLHQFNSTKQAAQWYGLLKPEEVRELSADDPTAFTEAMRLIATRAAEQNLHLILGDWSHIDWVGFPIVDDPPKHSSWDTFATVLNIDQRIATVRHPLDQFRSMKSTLRKGWDEEKAWQGIVGFARSVQTIPFWRYEDFLTDSPRILNEICRSLTIPYDDNWQKRWKSYKNITGDSSNSPQIRPAERAPVPDEVWTELGADAAFLESLELLGYPLPEPLRKRVYSLAEPSVVSDPSIATSTAHDTPLLVDWDAEVVRWREALDVTPNNYDVILRLATALRWIGNAAEALMILTRVIPEVNGWPHAAQVQAWRIYCEILESLERKFETSEARRRLAELEPEDHHNLFQLTLVLAGIGEVDESLAYSRRLLDLDQNHLSAAANFLLYINYSDRYTAPEISNEHFRLGMRFMETSQTIHKRGRKASQRVRVGYLASDFYTHPVGKLMLPILEAHDRSQIEVIIYHGGKKQDGITSAIRKTVDHFHRIQDWSDDRGTETIRKHELDVLIDLGGYTGGGNRLRVLARQVAPVQASFLGYPNTSALRTIDFHITDRFADPPGLTEHLYGERLVWLDHAHVSWKPYDIVDKISVPTRAGPLLGLFNNASKVSPSALNAYATILRRVPEAKLIIKYGDRFGVRPLQDRYRREFASRGVLPHRLLFHEKSLTQEEHLRLMMSVDLALDAFPYQGTMTSLECLAMGTPIVSRCGDYYAHRATSAMLMRMGMQELVASNAEEYVEIAVQLLQSLERLRLLRSVVRENFMISSLTDPAGLSRELELLYRAWT